METSAKTGFNAQKVFVEAAKVLYLDYLKYKDRVDSSHRNSLFSSSVVKKNSMNSNIKLSGETKKEEKAGGCPC